MSYRDVYIAERTMALRLEEQRLQTDTGHLAHEEHPEWEKTSRFFLRSLAWMGQCLVFWKSYLRSHNSSAPS
jgi:hypothetical protein